MAKSKNGLYVGIAVAVVVIVAVVVGVLVANRKNLPTGESQADTGTVESVTDDGRPVDTITDIDETIEFGDYDGMAVLSKSIQNGEATGKIVKIEGIVSRPMESLSIVQANADGSQTIGTQFLLDESDGAIFLKDGDHIVLTGKVIEKDPMYFVIQTWPEYVEIIESVDSQGNEVDIVEDEAAGDDTTLIEE